jgi:cyclophilin family peptidyl-prolyl cis-trans isomerase
MNDGPHTPEDDLDFGQTVRGLSPGQCLFQRYRLRSVLGRGGMGVVWLADDEQLDCPVALKFLPEIVTHDRQAIADLKREVIKSRALNHHHIVRVHDFVTDGVAAAISMEYVDGGTLSDLRLDQPGGVFEPEALLPWVEQLCSALTYAHGTARLVHRDLKPKNLMITSKGELKVADFGISRSITESASMGSLAHSSSGSPPYMSPQQIAGESPSPADDIYAVGATLYELLTGRPPFYRGGALAIMDQVKTKIPERVNERRRANDIPGEVPAHWEETIAACLAKAPAARPASAGEVWERLSGNWQVIQPVPQAVASVVATPVAAASAPVPQFDQAAVPKVIKFECPHCGQRISATAKEQGQPGRCPECAKGFMVPREQGEAGTTADERPEKEQVPEVAPSLPAEREKVEKVEIIWKPVSEEPPVPVVNLSPHNKRVFVTTVVLATALLGFVGWWFGIEQPKRPETARVVRANADAEKQRQMAADEKNAADEVAVLKTNKGTMVLEFWSDVAPKHVLNFKMLAKKGFYDDTAFHRVIKDFMIQGGDPLTKDDAQSARWGTGDPGYKIKAEFNDKKHVRGVLSMARSQDPDSAGSQFFICHGSPSFLDGKYTAFGKVISGDDVLEKIATIETAPGDRPVKKVVVESVKIVPRSEAK